MTKTTKNGDNITNGYKNKLITAYLHYTQYHDIPYTPHFLKQTNAQHIRIPTTQELDTLIQSAKYPLSLKLQISKETGLRPIELMRLRVKDHDYHRKTIRPQTAKYGLARTLELTTKTNELLHNYTQKRQLNPNQQIFKGDQKTYGNSYYQSRTNTAKKFNNPILTTIRLYDFRHYFATKLYQETKNILYVKQQLGHRNIENTMKYTQLIEFDEEEQYITEISDSLQRDAELTEHGYELATERGETKLFKKRK